MKALLDLVHGRLVYGRRIDRLATLLAERIPQGALVLDVGAGDGALAARLLELRPDLSISGVDVLARPRAAIAVKLFDGRRLPMEAAAVDVVVCIDVLHHAEDPLQLLSECGRVARDVVIIKDHLREGFLAGPILRLMDWAGNARHGVRLPYQYFSRAEFRSLIARCGLGVRQWNEALALYSVPADWIFGRALHVLATLSPKNAASVSAAQE
jgi:SAM-dependent methyltransferase